jgi:two-component system sensor histidine kinase UhpB
MDGSISPKNQNHCMVSSVLTPGDTNTKQKSKPLAIKTDKQTEVDNLIIKATKVHQRRKEYFKMDSVCEVALLKSKEIGYIKGQGNALSRKGIAKKYLGKLDEAKVCQTKALEIFKILHDSTAIIKCLSNLGILEKENGNFPEAYKYQLAGLKLAELIKDESGIATANMNIGLILKLQGQLNDAITSYRAAESIYRKLKDTVNLEKVITNKVTIFLKKQWMDSAILHNEELKKLFQYDKINSDIESTSLSLISTHRQIAQIALKKGDTVTAKKHRLEEFRIAKESVKTISKSGDISLHSRALSTLASAYYQFGFVDSARLCIAQSIKILEQLNNIVYLRGNYNSMAIVDSTLAEDKSKSFDERLAYSKEALKYFRLSEITKYKDLNEKNFKQLQELKLQYETEKKDQAIALLKRDRELDELELKKKQLTVSVLNLQNTSNNTQIELLKRSADLQQMGLEKTKTELELKTKKAEAQAAELKILERDKLLKTKEFEQVIWFRNLGIFGLVLLFIIGYLIANRFRLRQKLAQQQEIISQRKRLSADLHDDVGATLSSISIYTEAIKNKLKNNEPERVMELVNKIGENSRETISNLGDIVWNINPMNDTAEKLFNRMESTATLLFSAQNILLEFEADKRLFEFDFSLEAKQNLYLIFKETINNAAKYAEASQMKVSIKKVVNELEMKISDNGIGFDTEQISEGNGLLNIRRRIETLGGKVSITSSSAGTKTEIQLPLSALAKG